MGNNLHCNIGIRNDVSYNSITVETSIPPTHELLTVKMAAVTDV